MTREEAIKWLKTFKGNTGMTELSQAFDVAIKALEQEPCEDAISRQAVMDCFKKWQPYIATRLWDFEQELSALQSVNPHPKTGHWIRGKDRHFLDTRTNVNVEMKEATGKGFRTYINVQCSKCRRITIHDDSILYQYCPHCGAKMFEPQESEDKE